MVIRHKFPDNIDDEEAKYQHDHPAVQAYIKAAKENRGAFLYPTSFQQIITDWEDQQELKEEKAQIVAGQPKHLLTLPGYVVEYCYFHHLMLTPKHRPDQKYPIDGKLPRNLLEMLDQLRNLFRKTLAPEPMSPQLPPRELEQFFQDVDDKILKILTANPDADLMTYEETLKIHIFRIDTPKPPAASKPIKGFVT